MDQFPLGFRFHPTEEELVNHYLMGKVQRYTDSWVIPELEDFYAWDPWDLPRLYPGILNVPSDGWDWFFICPSPYVAQNSEHVKRKTRSGHWKITCRRDDIKDRDTKVLIGTKRILVFYKGCTKTGWVMHEYHLNPERLSGYSSTFQIPYILCRLKRKPSESLDTFPSFGGVSSVTDNTPVASQYGSTEDADQEPSFQATMEALPPFQTLDNNLPNYDLYTSFNPQHYVYGDGQGNDFWSVGT
ncbi:hypothetical protein ACJRO7_030210 [Eucalyptus globulus]|uniref:NAC domain-containing protein n=1 Tax=Eucalyptus globulus TaxID=34317 RepID=A0ABD3JLR9_EUCGL